MADITVKKVNSRSRMKFLPKHYGFQMLAVENKVYNLADTFLEGYGNGTGFWHYYETSNGAGFMVPAMEGPVTVNNVENYSSEKMSAEAAGLVLTILSLNNVTARAKSRQTYLEWELLMDYARNHKESSAIMKILD